MIKTLASKLAPAVTAAWCGGLAALAIHSLVGSRGPVGLQSRFGPPLAASGRLPCKFAVLGDVHAFRRPLTEAIRFVADRECAFLVQLGDFVDYDDEHDYRQFVKTVENSDIRLPLFLVRGNHESMSPDGSFTDHYLEYIAKSRYAFEFAGCLFVIVDSHEGIISPKDFDWMREELTRFRQTNRDGRAFMFMHIPPDAPSHDSPDMSDLSSEKLLQLAEEFRVDAIFAGHVHDHFTEDLGWTSLIVSGCGGGSLRAPSTDVHYLEVTVDREGFEVEHVPLIRESKTWASIRYAVLILVPRYRWYVFGGAILLLVREYLHLRKRKKTRAVACADAPK